MILTTGADCSNFKKRFKPSNSSLKQVLEKLESFEKLLHWDVLSLASGRSLMQKKLSVIIQTDASMTNLGGPLQ